MKAGTCGGQRTPVGEAADAPGAGVMSGWELPDEGAEN